MQIKSVNSRAIQPSSSAVSSSTDDANVEELAAALLCANKSLRHKQWDDAATSAQLALDLDITSVRAYEILAAAVLHTSQLERYANVVLSATQHCQHFPHFQSLQFQLSAMAPADARELVAAMYSVWPDEAMVQYFHVQFSGAPSANTAKNNRAPLPEKTSFDAVAIREALNGCKETALEQLSSSGVSANPVVAERAIEVRNIINAIPDRSSYQRPLIADSGNDITYSEASSNGGTVLYFSALGIDLIHTFDLIDSHFAAAGMASIFVRDHSHNLYLKGLKSIAGDRKATQQYLNELLRSLGTRRLVVVGRSGGGYGALQYGLEMGADRIVCFSAPTDMTLEFLKTANDTRGPSLASRLNKSHPKDDIQLSGLLERSSAVSEGIHLHYGADMEIDRNHAEHIASTENVHLYPIEGCSNHPSFIYRLGQKNFMQLIDG